MKRDPLTLTRGEFYRLKSIEQGANAMIQIFWRNGKCLFCESTRGDEHNKNKHSVPCPVGRMEKLIHQSDGEEAILWEHERAELETKENCPLCGGTNGPMSRRP